MAAYTVTGVSDYNLRTDEVIMIFLATNGFGTASNSPLIVSPGDTITFERDITSATLISISGLAIFTDNSDFVLTAQSPTVVRTVATGTNVADSITGTAFSATDTFYFSRETAVANVGPNASITASSTTPIYGETVTLSATGTDSDGTVSSISITQTAGTTVTLSTQTTSGTGTASATASRTFTAPSDTNTRTFTVTVTDNDGAVATDTVNVTASSVTYLTINYPADASPDDIVRAPITQLSNGDRAHTSSWTTYTESDGYAHFWRNSAGTLVKSFALGIVGVGNQQVEIVDPAASGAKSYETYSLELKDSGGVSKALEYYDVLYTIEPTSPTAPTGAVLNVPAGATNHTVPIAGGVEFDLANNDKEAYRVTLDTLSGEQTNTAVVNATLGNSTGYDRALGSDGAMTPYTSTNNTIQISGSDLPDDTTDATKTYRIWKYRYPYVTTDSTEYYGDGQYYDSGVTFTLTRSAPLAETGTITALDGTSETEGGGSLRFQFDITNPTSSGYAWDVVRSNGTVESGGELTGDISGTFTGTSKEITISFVSNTIVETGFQGESWVLYLYPVSNQNPALDQTTFTLYDNDTGLAVSESVVFAEAGVDTSHTINIATAAGGTGIDARVRATSGTAFTSDPPFTLASTNEVTVADVPGAAENKTYDVEVYNGNEWIFGDSYTVSTGGTTHNVALSFGILPQTTTLDVILGDTIIVDLQISTNTWEVEAGTFFGCSFNPSSGTATVDCTVDNFSGSSYSLTFKHLTGTGSYYYHTLTGSIFGGTAVAPVVSNTQTFSSSSPIKTFSFDGTTDSFTTSGVTATYALSTGTVLLDSTSTSPTFSSPTFASISGSTNSMVKVKLRRVSGVGWLGRLEWKTTTRAYDNHRKNISTDPTVGANGDWVVVEYDMRIFNTGDLSDWLSSSITGIRFIFGDSDSDVFEVSWIAIGPPDIGLTSFCSVALDDTGSGGLLQYNVSTNTTVPTSNWLTDPEKTFEVLRNNSYYFWARQGAAEYDRTDSDIAVPGLSPDSSISGTLSLSSLTWDNTTDITLTISGGSPLTVYRIVTTNVNNVSGQLNKVISEHDGNVTHTLFYNNGDLPKVGTTASYKVQARKTIDDGGSGSWVDCTGTNSNFNISRGTGVSATLATPSSVDEGSSANFTVTTSGFTSGTLYWRGSPASDFVNAEGTVSITSSSGTFSAQILEDFLTESNPETATMTIYYDSARTISIGGGSFNINDTSNAYTGLYGLQIFNTTGDVVFSPNYRANNIVLSETISLPANTTSSAILCEDLTPTNTDRIIISWGAYVVNETNYNDISLSRGTGSFTFTNSNTQNDASVFVKVYRIG